MDGGASRTSDGGVVPDRVVKESIGRSQSLSKVSLMANLLWGIFLTVMDDHGCFDARPAIVKAQLFPLRKDVTEEMIEGWLQEYAAPGVEMIRLWEELNGVRYGECISFEFHNDLLSKKAPTTPCPPWLRSPSGVDPRLATDTLQAFERIGVAVAKLSSDGKTPTYREIIKEAGCSASTLAKYRKHTNAAACYTALQGATDATAKNQNKNLNRNKNKEKKPAPVDDRRVPFKDFMYAELRSVGVEPITDASDWDQYESFLTKTRAKPPFALEKLQEYFRRFVHSPENFHRRQGKPIRWFVNNVAAFMRDGNGTHQGNGSADTRTAQATTGFSGRNYTPKQ